MATPSQIPFPRFESGGSGQSRLGRAFVLALTLGVCFSGAGLKLQASEFSGPNALPPLHAALGHARAFTEGRTLVVSSGTVERRWLWTGTGLATVGLKDLRTGQDWVKSGASHVGSDWTAPGLMGEQPARLVSLTAGPSTDGQFTSKMLQVVAAVLYPGSRITVRYVVWAYPDGPGLRTQLWVKGNAAALSNTSRKAVSAVQAARVDYLPIDFSNARAAGYYNSTQHRHEPDKHLLRDEVVRPGVVDWANLVATENSHGGVMLVKESHKCVNQPGVDTGAFVLATNGVAVTGWGLPLSALSPASFQWCWATWTILYPTPGADARELAIKEFDRLRYPIREDLDMYIKANTWGSGTNGPDSMRRASEKEVLAEIDSVADLGLDALQIDDGWEEMRMPGKHPRSRDWFPRPDWYPDGWTNVVAKATQRRIKLGLWMAARAPLPAMEWNYDHSHFATWKLDFANLNTYPLVQSYLAKGRAFVAYTGHRVRVNWDVTENAPRFGYFWARECGSIWLANRKPLKPVSTVPKPWLMLRETWELARYLNNNKFELPIQNFRMVDPKLSDAHLYSQTYAVALGLSGIPVFFQTTRWLRPEERAAIHRFLDIYKAQRAKMFADYVFPVGDQPSNASWSGFQWINPKSNTGYLLIFRERLNDQAQRRFPLRFVRPGTPLELKNLRTGDVYQATSDTNAAVRLTIAKPADVLFLQYQVEE